MKITPMLYVDQVEPSLKFWTERLGFTVPVTVPDGDKIGFAILVKDNVELMLQSRHSMGDDRPKFMPYTQAGLNLYVEVQDFADLQKRMRGADIVEPVRTTFYGMQEIVVKEPGGNLVVFAAKAPSKQ